MPPDILQTLFANLDKGLSAILLVYFITKLLPALKKIAINYEVLKTESQNTDETLKELIRKVDGIYIENVRREARKSGAV